VVRGDGARRIRTMGYQSDTSWMDDAACAGHDDLDYFDLDCGLEAALTLCVTCPVGDQCLDYAIKHKLTDGIWGGEWGDSLARLVGRRRGGSDHG
jgi:WhiB family transcriptional regulator, redox-sensing transcriptional regulator